MCPKGGPMFGFGLLPHILEVSWVKELKSSYRSPETMLFTIYPYYGYLNEVP